MPITSRRNPLVRRLARLVADPAARRGEGVCVAEGPHLVREALAASVEVRTLVHTPEALARAEVRALVDAARDQDVDVVEMTASCYARFSALKSPEGLAAVAAWRPIGLEACLNADVRLVVLAGVQDPGNAGAVVRTALAAGAGGAVLCGGADPSHPGLVRASMGALFRLPLAISPMDELAARARSAGVRLLVAHARGAVDYRAADYRPPVAVVVGAEGGGVPPELVDLADARVTIPMAPGVESLNVAVAAGVLLYRARDQWSGEPSR